MFRPILLSTLLLPLLMSGCSTDSRAPTEGPSRPASTSASNGQRGQASFYSDVYQGRPTASGERFDQNALTAAHRSLPFGTRVQVSNLDNGHQVIVRINDRGPYVKGRIIDLSKAAARRLDMQDAGVAPVRIRVLD